MYSSRHITQVAVAVAGLCAMLASGCARESLSDGLSDSTDCSSCHGTPGNPAPPKAVNGATATTDIGVGAHAIHLTGSAIAGPVACSECHPLPTDLLTHPAQQERPGVVTFGALATTGGVVPVWNRAPGDCQTTRCRGATGTCTNTYCHGATQFGAESRPPPVWTQVDGTFSGCASCHGFPPAGTHPTIADCNACHGAVGGTGGVITNPILHVNGVVDFMSVTAGSFGVNSMRFASNAWRTATHPSGVTQW